MTWLDWNYPSTFFFHFLASRLWAESCQTSTIVTRYEERTDSSNQGHWQWRYRLKYESF